MSVSFVSRLSVVIVAGSCTTIIVVCLHSVSDNSLCFNFNEVPRSLAVCKSIAYSLCLCDTALEHSQQLAQLASFFGVAAFALQVRGHILRALLVCLGRLQRA